jgi:hypothetical protein
VNDVIVGLLVIAVGALFCFRGYLTMRIIIPFWGALAGFLLGAGVVDAATDDGFLRNALGWIIGFCVAFVFGLIAYLYYEVSILIGMTFIGFALGTSMMVALGVTWSWVIVLVGILVGALLAFVAIMGNLPMVLLTILTAAGGASAIVAGVMLLGGTLSTDDLGEGATTEIIADNGWWYALYLALLVAGIVVQIRFTEKLAGSLRESWVEDGGKELRQSPANPA